MEVWWNTNHHDHPHITVIRWRHRWRHSSPNRPAAGNRLRIPLVGHDGRLGPGLGCLELIRIWVGMVRKCIWLDHREAGTEPIQ